jgi:hypothetical protein
LSHNHRRDPDRSDRRAINLPSALCATAAGDRSGSATWMDDLDMRAYDPLNAPDPDAWQSMDEDERMTLVLDHHRKAAVKLPNARVHAAIHVIVENQIALGDEIPAQSTLARLMREGLDRHEAIHAVGSVLINFLHELLGGGDAGPKANERYYKELKKLRAAKWLKGFP